MVGNSPSGSAPDSVYLSVWQMPVALSSTSTSPARGPSSCTVSIVSGAPALWATAARTSMELSHRLYRGLRLRLPRICKCGIAHGANSSFRHDSSVLFRPAALLLWYWSEMRLAMVPPPMPSIPDDIFTEPDDFSPDTLTNLGPLRHLAGVWQSDQGADINAKAAGPERRGFREHIRMEPIDPATNAPLLLHGLAIPCHIT